MIYCDNCDSTPAIYEVAAQFAGFFVLCQHCSDKMGMTKKFRDNESDSHCEVISHRKRLKITMEAFIDASNFRVNSGQRKGQYFINKIWEHGFSITDPALFHSENDEVIFEMLAEYLDGVPE